jgi:hypothetical protein
MPHTHVYVPASALSAVKRGSKNATSAARQLMDAVFHETALATCSVRGKIAKGPLGRPSVRRNALDSAGIDAILGKQINIIMKKKPHVVPEFLVCLISCHRILSLRSRSAPNPARSAAQFKCNSWSCSTSGPTISGSTTMVQGAVQCTILPISLLLSAPLSGLHWDVPGFARLTGGSSPCPPEDRAHPLQARVGVYLFSMDKIPLRCSPWWSA